MSEQHCSEEPELTSASCAACESDSESAAGALPITDLELAELRTKAAEAEEYKTKYLRNLAEMENAKKRLQRERAELIQFANEQLVLNLLDPLDQMEKALHFAEQSHPEVRGWAQGFEMILRQLKDALQGAGAHGFEARGTAFDPMLHEAVEVVTSEEHPAGTIVQQFTRGYKMGNRVIRPARVQVAQSAEGTELIKEQTENKE